MKFGQLTVTSVTPGSGAGKHAKIHCDCLACGGSTVLQSAILKKSKSCGCQRRVSDTWKRKGAISKPWKLPHGEAACRSFYASYRSGARRASKIFELTLEDFKKLTKQQCHYCGAEATKARNSKRKDGTFIYNGNYIGNGVDRTDSSKGYTIENCVACCPECNFSKLDRSVDQFLGHAMRVVLWNKATQLEHREIAKACWDIIERQFPSLKGILEQ